MIISLMKMDIPITMHGRISSSHIPIMILEASFIARQAIGFALGEKYQFQCRP